MSAILKEKFVLDVFSSNKEFCVLTVAVKLPTGAIEVITNHQNIKEKIDYYLNTYDQEFKSKNNPEVQIVGYMAV